MRPPIRQIFEEAQGSSSIETKVNTQVKPSFLFPYYNQNHHLSRGLIAAWPFWEGNGDRLGDVTLNKNHGDLVGPIWRGSQKGFSLDFDGSNDHVLISNSSSLQLPFAFTLNAWINPDALGVLIIVGQDTSYKFYTGAAGISLYNADAGSDAFVFENQGTLVIGQWNHVVVTNNGAAVIGYINGSVINTTIYSNTFGSPNATVKIGEDPSSSSQNFNGRIYNRALSSEEVKQLFYDPWGIYRQPTIRRYIFQPPDGSPNIETKVSREEKPYNYLSSQAEGLIGLWSMNQGYGTSILDLTTRQDGLLGSGTGVGIGQEWVGSEHGDVLKFDATNGVDVGGNAKFQPSVSNSPAVNSTV